MRRHGNLSKLLKDDLTVVQGVAMYKDRPIVPPSLVAEVLDTLHSRHQGATSMVVRVSNYVWWPGMNNNIRTMRASGWMCDSNTPSQPKKPLVPLPDIQYLLQQICSALHLGGKTVPGHRRQVQRLAERPSSQAGKCPRADPVSAYSLQDFRGTRGTDFGQRTTVHLCGAANFPGDLGYRPQAQ